MRVAAAVAISVCLIGICKAATGPRVESCGWLIEDTGTLSEQPSALLKPRDPGPIPTPPPHAVAVYCDREGIVSDDGDVRITEMNLPLVIRQGDRIGVIEYPPKVVFNYHWTDGKFRAGAETPNP